MSGLRISCLALCGCLSAPAFAQPPDALQFFAACTGRLSAEMEFSWLMQDGEAADEAQEQRASLIALVDALMVPGEGAQVMEWRINAKMAHAALLVRATFNDAAEDAEWAGLEARRARRNCTDLLLS